MFCNCANCVINNENTENILFKYNEHNVENLGDVLTKSFKTSDYDYSTYSLSFQLKMALKSHVAKFRCV